MTGNFQEIEIELDKSELERLREISREENKTLSEVVNDILSDYIKIQRNKALLTLCEKVSELSQQLMDYIKTERDSVMPKAKAKKPVVDPNSIHLHPTLMARLQKFAQDEYLSVDAAIEVLLDRATVGETQEKLEDIVERLTDYELVAVYYFANSWIDAMEVPDTKYLSKLGKSFAIEELIELVTKKTDAELDILDAAQFLFSLTSEALEKLHDEDSDDVEDDESDEEDVEDDLDEDSEDDY